MHAHTLHKSALLQENDSHQNKQVLRNWQDFAFSNRDKGKKELNHFPSYALHAQESTLVHCRIILILGSFDGVCKSEGAD